LLRTGIPTGQPKWDPFETGGLIPYRAPLGRNEGNICEKCVQDLGSIWGIHMGTYMEQVDKNRLGLIWVAHMGPI